jgi:hypothetical protein
VGKKAFSILYGLLMGLGWMLLTMIMGPLIMRGRVPLILLYLGGAALFMTGVILALRRRSREEERRVRELLEKPRQARSAGT